MAAAQDTGGEAAAGKWYDNAKATFTTLVDRQHTVSTTYSFINVPTGMWVDEQGRIARPAEQAWTYSDDHKYGDHILTKDGLAYVAALKDWVVNGGKSKFYLTDEDYRRTVKPRSPKDMEADANFKLAVWFHDHDNGELAAKYWKRAQELNPDDWNYARQDWSFTPADAGKKWMQKLQSTDKDYKYYPKLEIPRE